MASRFAELVAAETGRKAVLQGNLAFALGCARHGIHVADGYPGTPSTEVIDKGLALVPDVLTVNWSVNEAAAVASGLGAAIAGKDAVVTMKVPGLFQAADIVSTMAFYHEPKGGLVLYVATDFVPSSTQHLVDPRYFLLSCCLPVIEPRNHQDIYQSGWIAADISRKFNTPVVILASGRLCHSEGTVTLEEPRVVEPVPMPGDLKPHLLLPSISRVNYDRARLERLPAITKWVVGSRIVVETAGTDDFGIISYGMNEIIAKEALDFLDLDPGFLSVGMSNPLPYDKIVDFAARHDNEVIVFEDGYRFVQDQLNLMGIKASGKRRASPNTDWTPEGIVDFLTKRKRPRVITTPQPPPRPPVICVGCPYRAFGETVRNLKKKQKIHAVFGDIGCNTLLMFLDAIDTCASMGASENMRQGFVIGRPEMASKVLSVVGDSTECHSGLDATRNAVFRNVPGVKVVLDNYGTAMTGGQPAPTSPENLANEKNRFDLAAALRAEGADVIEVDAYDVKAVKKALRSSLEKAESGVFTTIVLSGACMRSLPDDAKVSQWQIDPEKCQGCNLCLVCPGISLSEDTGLPQVNSLCTNCGSQGSVCKQFCNLDAFVTLDRGDTTLAGPATSDLPKLEWPDDAPTEKPLPETIRLAARGVGGQGILFLGKVLVNVALNLGYGDSNIIKGETHGMAQLGGPVLSTFGCGRTYSPVFHAGTVDVLIALEMGEVLRDGFLTLLKPGGTVLLNTMRIETAMQTDYPSSDEILAALAPNRVICFNAESAAREIGSAGGLNINTLALGVLSCTQPFDAFPLSAWKEAITSIGSSPERIHANLGTFGKGRALHPGGDQ